MRALLTSDGFLLLYIDGRWTDGDLTFDAPSPSDDLIEDVERDRPDLVQRAKAIMALAG